MCSTSTRRRAASRRAACSLSATYMIVHVHKKWPCPLHISRSDAPAIGLRDVVGGNSGRCIHMFNIARRRRPIGSRTCTTQLRVVINKTLSPYQPGSRTILYDSLVPTDANGHIARHSANVNGVPTRRRMVSCRETIHIGRADSIGAQSGHRIG